ncbi:MAG: putative Lactoylglutathione lyase [Amycolatopsis sp.]|jgi:glyoxylase I family protein|uniref:VOC family protein n=1 Tax=Amycolatopsis sp. TaxID=37632 RepID=UPI002633B6B3|nr:VOC family protein [Amycolatopsis sp.]MCU1680090.1 putative Lactoylglutathione lyase [Amycolatopsis sp.]
MKPLAVHHVSIVVTDVREAARFYTDVLGMELRTDRPDDLGPGAWLNVGDQQLHVLEGGSLPGDVGQHFAILVGDLDAAKDELGAAGLAVTDASPVGTSRQAFCRDPFGNLIELHEVAR